MVEAYLHRRFKVDHGSPAVRARVRRVLILVSVIITLSVADLVTTLTYLQTVGMQELNPFAAYVLRHQSIAALLLFKFGSVFASISLILLVRRLPQGEMAAWIATAILVGLTLHWSTYTDQMLNLQNTETFKEAQSSESWMTWPRSDR